MSQHTSMLLNLPRELLILIVDSIEDTPTLQNAGRTCERLRQLTDEHIYRDVFIRSGLDSHYLMKDLEANPIRTRNIHDLAIRYKIEDQEGIEDLSPKIKEMSHLRHLHIETPCPNDLKWRDGGWDAHGRVDIAEVFSRATILRDPAHRRLTSLQSFTYHSHGAGNLKYTLPDHSIFLHPTLKTIKLSCVDFNLTPRPTQAHNHTTALETLIFEECNIGAHSLLLTLALPRALHTLILGERKYHFHTSPTPLLATHLSTLLSALALQSHSLSALTHDGGSPNIFDDSPGASTASFRAALPSLTSLHVGASSFLHRYLQAAAHPPRLRRLALNGLLAHHLEHLEQILAKYTQNWLPSPVLSSDNTALYTLDIHMRPAEGCATTKAVLEALWRMGARRIGVRTLGEKMRAQGCRVRVWASRRVDYIPPYMYGEEEPMELVAWDSLEPDVWPCMEESRVRMPVYRRSEIRHVSEA